MHWSFCPRLEDDKIETSRPLKSLVARDLLLAVSDDRGNTWKPENIDPNLPQREEWLQEDWKQSMVLGHIPQVLSATG